jgi:hypothetical protein
LKQCNLDQHAFLPCPTITIWRNFG